jgi:CDP-diacylglycerol--glycerol-3-phosphate 3-phosphatidyltransferase
MIRTRQAPGTSIDQQKPMEAMSEAPRHLSRQHLTGLPNVLTYMRLAAIPVLILLLIQPTPGESTNLAFLVFGLASLTDYFDGILARRHNMVTALGKLLDPLADKLLSSAALIMMIPIGKVQAWLVFLILGREMTITGLRSIAASHGLILDASRMGKNKMISQICGILFLLLTIPGVTTFLEALGTAFLWVSLILGFWSARDYFVQVYRHARSEAGGPEPQ